MSGQSSEALGVAVRFIARRNDQIQQALQVLQRAQRHYPKNAGEMGACSQGEWIAIDDVVKAIRILEGQQ